MQYKDTDASGMAHFTVFFTFAEEAEHAMWREAGLSVEPEGSTIGWPRVSASFEYQKALRFEDTVEVHLRVIAKTTKTLTYQAVLKRDGEVVAVGQHTSICVRKAAAQAIKAADMPDEIARAFAVTAPIEGLTRRAK